MSPQLSARLASLSSTLATKVPPRVLLPTLTKCYNDMVPAKQVCGSSVNVGTLVETLPLGKRFVIVDCSLIFVTKTEFISVSSFLQSHLGPLMSILKAHISHMEKDQLNTHQSELTSFFLIALDFRAQYCQVVMGSVPSVRLSVFSPHFCWSSGQSLLVQG